jgi:diguanylate cyclase (GGDEF)-like protein
MPLRRRLTVFFILIVMLPLMAAGFVMRFVVDREVESRNNATLRPALEVTRAIFRSRSATLDELVLGSTRFTQGFVSALRTANTPRLQEIFEAEVKDAAEVDFLIALDRAGDPVGSFSEPARFAAGFEVPSESDLVRGSGTGSGPGFVAQRIPVSAGGQKIGSLVGGFWVDGSFLSSSGLAGAELAIVSGETVIASTEEIGGRVEVSSTDETFSLEGLGTAAASALGAGMTSVAWTSQETTVADTALPYMIGLLLLALLITAVLAQWLARLITEPLDELTEGAAAISQGRFDHHIPVRSRDEVGRLAMAFNDMSAKLGDTVGQLQLSRDQLQLAVQRVGETLRATHDMRSILDSVLNTAADAVVADAAILWSLTPARDQLYPAIGRGIELEETLHVRVGHGLVGHVARDGTTILTSANGRGLRPEDGEPSFPEAMVVPLYSQNRIAGAISLYRRDPDNPFNNTDLETVIFLSEQGGTAIENVSLHEEAQRLSITDGLTGVWNRRYFQMQFRQVLATALRFDRPFSLLMLDLDNFKRVNDTYGHQRGDAVLIEFAQRVTRTLREVDTFARFGGEEFICILSETDLAGAVTAAQKIQETIKRERFGGPGETALEVTVSIGVASYPEHGDNYQALVGAADRALYRAKQEGRDRARVADRPSKEVRSSR